MLLGRGRVGQHIDRCITLDPPPQNRVVLGLGSRVGARVRARA